MASKRYYWIKLKKTFFSDMQQRKMRKQQRGELLLLIYLKLMVATCDAEGKFYYQGVFDDICTEIAETIVEDVEDVRFALEYFRDNRLIILSDDECFTPEVLNCIGSEGDSAERMRKSRMQKKASQSDEDVTTSDTDVTCCDTEKEIEIEKDVDIDSDTDNVKSTLSTICTSTTISTNTSTNTCISNIPTVDQVENECSRYGFEIEPEKFVEHCKSRNIKDWKFELYTYSAAAAGRNRNRRKEMKE